eukprot:XP_017176758.1 PREDICTED: cadherin-23-like isoform X2 [Mus musculus]
MDFKHTLFVRVSDEGIPVLSTIIRIILRVSRINEHNPAGSMMEFTFSIFENSPTDTLVGKITFIDEDWPFNNIHYSIVGGNFGIPPTFYIESDTGMIKLLSSLDREVTSQYKITVRVIDMGNDVLPDPLRQRSATAQVTINVLITTSVLRKISYYWRPDSWFSAVLTLAGVLFMMGLYAVVWCLFKDVQFCSRLFPHCHRQKSQPSLTVQDEKDAEQVPSDRNAVSTEQPDKGMKRNFFQRETF